MQIYADVLYERIKLAESGQSVALGAAILGTLAAGAEASGHASVSQAIHAMARQREDLVYRPDLRARRAYDRLYGMYRQLAARDGALAGVMRDLRESVHAPGDVDETALIADTEPRDETDED
jgi:L-ribulokinase